MPVFWRNRGNRHNRGTQIVAGTRITTADDGGHHHHHHHHGNDGGTNVIVGEVVDTTSRPRRRGRRRYYSSNPSTLHGLWNRFLGALTFNRRRRRHGAREMRKASETRRALRVARRVQGSRSHGHLNKLRKFHTRGRHHHHDEPAVVVAQDTGHEHRHTPWMHYHHRTLPSNHGVGDVILGLLTFDRHRRARGWALMEAAREERRRERRRRRDDLRDLGKRYRERSRQVYP